MDSNKALENQMQKININSSNTQIDNIKSKYILKLIFDYLNEKKCFDIIKYTKKIQQTINKNSSDYKKLLEIEIEIMIDKNKMHFEKNNFININEKDRKYYHIYFDDNKEEIKRKDLAINKDEKVSKINIIIDYQIKSLQNLFCYCYCIVSINFKKFYRNNIINMSKLFGECHSLKEINLFNFNTSNVTDMSEMFLGCHSLKEINLSKFNTNNVKNMSDMFKRCTSIKKLNLSNFNTNNVTHMKSMFDACSSLERLNLSNFNTNNVVTMEEMFSGCVSLKELNLSNFKTLNTKNTKKMFFNCKSLIKLNLTNFNFDNVIFIESMFKLCPFNLIMKIQKKFKCIKEKAFE